MFIKTLKVENWKSFQHKSKWNFNRQELIIDENGSGKTSKFQAIMYAIWGKYPQGFNANTVRYNDEKNARVELYFTFGSDEENNGHIVRQFGSKAISELYVNDNLVAESVRNIEKEMNKIVSFSIASQIWTNSITDSDILSSKYFTDVVLKDILEDANDLLIKFKSKIRYSNKIIASFGEQKIIDGESIKNEIDLIEQHLNNQNNKKYNNSEFENAKLTEQAFNKLEELKKEHPEFKISKSDARDVYQLLGSKSDDEIKDFKKNLQDQIDLEKSKEDSIYREFNKNDILKIARKSLELGYSLIGGSEFGQNEMSKLQKELDKPLISQNKIKQLEGQLQIANYDINEARILRKYLSLKRDVDKNPNFQEIITKYNEKENENWSKYKKLQSEYQKYLIQKSELEKIYEEKQKVERWQEFIVIITEYITKATKYYTSRILDKASENLQSMNSRYKGLYIEGKTFTVILENVEHQIAAVPVIQMSSGEKTMVALSLLTAVHDIMVPELPYLYDEVFSALDVNNLDQIRTFLKNQKSQTFIISHDSNWKEF